MLPFAASWRGFVLALLAISLMASSAAAAAKEMYDPENEGFMDQMLRSFQKHVMKRSDEEITGARLQISATLNPTFNSRISKLTSSIGGPAVHFDGASINELVLHMPSPPEASIDDSVPWKAFAPPGTKDGGSKVWVILASAPSGDAASRHFNQVFNETMNLVNPPPSAETLVEAISEKVVSSSPFDSADGEEAADGQSDEERKVQERRRERIEVGREKVKDWHFGVVDFEEEPDLMWAWWIWKVPVVIFVTPSTSPDRLYDMRFWKVAFISGLTPEYILSFIASGTWKTELKVWKSPLAPGGARAQLTAQMAKPSNYLYNKFSAIPNWILGIASTAVGGSLLSLLHSFGGGGGGSKSDAKKEGGEKKDGDKQIEGSSTAVKAGGETASSRATRSKKSS